MDDRWLGEFIKFFWYAGPGGGLVCAINSGLASDMSSCSWLCVAMGMLGQQLDLTVRRTKKHKPGF